LLQAAERREVGNRVDPGHFAATRQAGGNADQVLFGHADIDVAVREATREALQHRIAEIGGEQPDALVVGGDFQ